MALLIPDLDMPNNCSECPLNYDQMYCNALEVSLIFTDRTRKKTWWDTGIDIDKRRLPDCPLMYVNKGQVASLALKDMLLKLTDDLK